MVVLRTLALAFLLLPAAAHADEAADRHAAAASLLEQLHSADAMSSMMPRIVAQIRTNLTHDDPTLTRQFDVLVPRLMEEAAAEKSALFEKLVDVYATTYTLDELHKMSDFYRTPTGQKMIASEPMVNGGMLAAARDWGTRVAFKLNAEAAAELQGPAH